MIKHKIWYEKFGMHVKTIYQTYFGFILITLMHFIRFKKNPRVAFLDEDEVTLVITSCDRFQNLRSTLESFRRNNTYGIKKVIHVEDGQCIKSLEFVREFFADIEVKSVFNERNLGQLNSIDLAYGHLDTKYFFHLEEDWGFVAPGFIEYSLEILRSDSKVLFVSLREASDQNKHPLKPYNDLFYTTKPFWRLVWVGFGFNPSLRRTSDAWDVVKFGGLNRRETGPGLFYYLVKRKKVLVSKTTSFIVHEGWGVSTYQKYKKA